MDSQHVRDRAWNLFAFLAPSAAGLIALLGILAILNGGVVRWLAIGGIAAVAAVYHLAVRRLPWRNLH